MYKRHGEKPIVRRVIERKDLGLLGEYWESSGRRNVGDVGFGGWSWSDVAAGT